MLYWVLFFCAFVTWALSRGLFFCACVLGGCFFEVFGHGGCFVCYLGSSFSGGSVLVFALGLAAVVGHEIAPT